MVCAREAQPEEEGWWKKLVVMVVVTYNFHVHRGGTEFLEFLGLEFFFVVVHGEMPRHVNRLTSLPSSLKKFPTQFPTSFSGPSRSSPLPLIEFHRCDICKTISAAYARYKAARVRKSYRGLARRGTLSLFLSLSWPGFGMFQPL